MKKIIAIALMLVLCVSMMSVAAFAEAKTYYMVGYINGADYGSVADSANMGDYKFVNGKLTVQFDQDSYIFLKTEGNADWLNTEAYVDSDTTATFKANCGEKMKVPGNVQLNFTLVENADGSVTLSYTTGNSGSTQPTEPTTQATEPTTQPTTQASGTSKKVTLNVKVPADWTKACAYSWDSTGAAVMGDWPGTAMTKSGDWYKGEIAGDITNLIINNGAEQAVQTVNLTITAGKDVWVVLADKPNASNQYEATITYTAPSGTSTSKPQGGQAADKTPTGPLSNYRVVGNAAWMGNWDPANALGQMHDEGNGVYKKNFENVEPGSYQLKVTKDGKWDDAVGDGNGQNFTFTVTEKCTITVTFTMKDGKGVIFVKGAGVPSTADVSMFSVVVLLTLATTATAVLVLNKKKFI